MKIEQMLETEAHFRLGSVSNLNPTPDDVMAERGRRHGISLFGFDTAEYRPLDINGWSKRLEQNPDSGSWDIPKDASGPLLRHRRNIELVADVQPFGDIGVFYADMRDAVTIADPAFPIFQYNRRKGAPNSVLWPLRRVHDIGSHNFFGSMPVDPVKFTDKKPTVFWRGNLSGDSNVDGDRRRVRGLVAQFLEGQVPEDEFVAHLETIPRYRFVSKYAQDPRFDLGFVPSESNAHFADCRHIAPYIKPASTREECMENKYPIALAGTDVSTLFGWLPEANVLTFKEDYNWEVFFDCHFKPNIDFLSVSTDFSNVLEHFEWAESHPAECMEMVEHAQSIAKVIGTQDFRDQSNGRLLALYKEAVQAN